MSEEPRRPRGRPRVAPADRPVSVHLRFPAKQYDAVYERARDAHVSVPEYIRRAMHTAPGSGAEHKD